MAEEFGQSLNIVPHKSKYLYVSLPVVLAAIAVGHLLVCMLCFTLWPYLSFVVAVFVLGVRS